MTHAELVKRAERWLRNTRRCDVVLSEVACSSGETPDAIGWRYGGRLSVLVECKASRADFLADRKKITRQPGMVHSLGDERYYLAPSGIIVSKDLPPLWGLLEIRGSLIKCVKKAEQRPPSAGRKVQEMSLLWGELRLVQIARSGRPLYPTKRNARIERDLGV